MTQTLRASFLYRRLGRIPPKAGAVKTRPPGVALESAQYAARLQAMLRAWYDHVETIARASLRADASAYRADALDDDLKKAFDALLTSSGLSDWLGRMVGGVARKQSKYLERVTKLPPSGGSYERAHAIEAFRRTNAALVTKLRDEQIADLADILRPAQNAGQRWEEVAPQIKKRLGVGESRAKLIARDQTNKFSAAVTQITQKDAGITRYRWSTAKDLAVRGRPGGEYPPGPGRENHWALEGTVHSWDDPPVIPGTTERAHPGQRIQCRCVAVPVIPLFEGLEQAPTLPAPAPAPAPAAAVRKQGAPLIRVPFDLTQGGRLPLREESLRFLRAGGAAADTLPVRVAVYPDGSTAILDGRHRITVARERGETSIDAEIVTYGKRGGTKTRQGRIDI